MLFIEKDLSQYVYLPDDERKSRELKKLKQSEIR